MTKLEKLIEELCPNGVEYKKIGEVSSFRRGSFPQPYGNSEWYDGEGAMPFVQVADIGNNMRLVDDTKRKISRLAQPKSVFAPEGSIVISLQGSIGRIAITQYDAYIDRTVAIFSDLSSELNDKYFVYQLQRVFSIKEKTARGSTIKTITKDEFTNFEIPVPSLDIQSEIVRILDNFTERTSELNEKLDAELTARKKQYEYYRNFLLVNAKDKVNVTLDLISENCDSQRKPVTSGKRESGNIPYYGASGIVDYVKDYIFDGDYLLVSEDGANLLARSTPIAFSISGKTWVNNHAHVLKFDEYATRRYVEIYLNSIDLSRYITGGAQPKLNQKNLNMIEIPLPPLDEQQRIVDILDRFDAFCNDISQGLPAEIEARQKQYEYYRDKLLTFKEK